MAQKKEQILCGFAGIFHRDGQPANASLIGAMTDRLAHRGPDGRGVWVEGSVGLGHRRLAIRDLTSAGAQPFHSACGNVVVVFNGEIYNDREIARELARASGYVPRTRSDTEVIPAAWLVWGPDFLDRLEGMYAFALFDRRTQTLLLARDPIGIKPLYIYEAGPSLRFASEPKAFFADPGFGPALSPADLDTMLALGYVGPNRSILAGVRQLAPGTRLLSNDNGVNEQRFWRPRRQATIKNAEEAGRAVLDTLRAVVSDQIVSDVPIAVLQSGGIDSSLVSATLPATSDARLFTVRFAQRLHDESKMAGTVADALRRPIKYLDMPADDHNIEADFRAVVRAVDGGLADSSALAMYRLSRRVKHEAKVALSGDGADEFFAGYPTYRATAVAKAIGRGLPQAIPRTLARWLATFPGQSEARVSKIELVTRLLDGFGHATPHAVWRRYLRDDWRVRLYGPGLAHLHAHDPLQVYAAAGSTDGTIWDQSLLADQTYYLPADMLVKVDRMSMAHGLEVRVPFLDRRMMTLAGQIDRTCLADYAGHTKIALRRAASMAGLPASLTQERKKGFNVPMNRILSTGLRPLADYLLDQNADILSPYCRADEVRATWRQHRDKVRDHKFLVWTLLVLATWLEEMKMR